MTNYSARDILCLQTKMESLGDYFTLGNVLLAILFLLILNQLIEFYQFRNMPPGPRFTSLPFIGNLTSFDSTEPGEGFLESTASLRKKYGRVYSMKVGSYKAVFAENTASVKEVLVKKSGDYAGRPPFNRLLLNSLGGKDIGAANYGPAWRFHRKLFMSAVRLYLSNQQLIEERISQQTGRLLKYFDDQNGEDFNPSQILMESVANVICRVTFGKHFDSSHPEFGELLKLSNTVFTDAKINNEAGILDFFPFAKYLPFRSYKEIQRMNDRIFEILGKRLETQEKHFDPTAEVDSLVGSLLKERAEAASEVGAEDKAALLSDDYMLGTINDMFSAGYETTSTTLRWAIAFLVHNPECQKEIQDQLDNTVERDRMPSLDDRLALPLVQATIMETLRLGNVSEVALHYTLKETSLAGYRVPKDAVVVVNIRGVHEDPSCWENPMTFNPHRFIDSNGQLIINSGNFLPFAAGRRVCAGESLAKVELFLFLSWMLHKFTFLPAKDGSLPDLKGISGFSHHPATYNIRAVKRE